MVFEPLTHDVNVIAKLGDNPNSDNNLSAQELKEKFDEAGVAIKKYLNEYLVPELAQAFTKRAPNFGWSADGFLGTDEQGNVVIRERPVPEFSIGEVAVLEAGTPAYVTITGTNDNPVLNLGIPKGFDGKVPDLTVGSVQTVGPDEMAFAYITGTAELPKLHLGLPQGTPGAVPKFTVGTVESLDAGAEASASITGTDENPVLNLGIPKGKVPNLKMGTVKTGEAGSAAQAVIGGSAEEPVLDLSIPRGATGATPNLRIGTVETLEPGADATASITGGTEAPLLNLGIPGGAVRSVGGILPDANGDVPMDWVATRTLQPQIILEETSISKGFSKVLTYEMLEGQDELAVTYDGKLYVCVPNFSYSEGDGYFVEFGNCSLLSSSEDDTGEPFYFWGYKGSSSLIAKFEDSAAHTMSITGSTYEYVKLPEEYLPDDIGAVKTVNGVAPDENGNVEITIPDSSENASVEPADDDIPKVFITGVKPTTKDDVLAEMEYVSKTNKFHAFLTIKCQGTSSMSYAKKNFTVKLYSDEARKTKLKKSFKDWNHNGNKYVLKANFIDHSHARNIVSARLWNEVVKSRPDYDSLPEEMRNSPRNGAVDGFPIKVYYNGSYEGIYTWNIGKEDWQWGMDEDNPNHVLLCAETNTDGTYRATPCNFRKLWNGVNEQDWSVEVGTNSTALKTSLNNLIQFVMDNDGDAFRNGIGDYLDIQSAIDYYIFQYEVCGLDGLAKNMLLATYDGTLWRCGAYDLDSTFGLWWNGTKFVSATYACPEDYQEEFSLLWERIEANYLSELKARQAELRKTVLSYSNIVTHFERFMDVIGLDLYAEDLTVYTAIPCGSTNNIKQIRNFIHDRQAYVDAEFDAMSLPVACTGISLDKSTLTFTAEGTQTITATPEPDGCTDAVVWVSSNPEIAVISVSGYVCTVEAIANGNTTITATCGEYSASCSVAVSGIAEPVPCTGITLDKTELAFDGEGSQTIVATVTPADTTDLIAWSSDNKNVATVEDGVVTAKGNGSANITATCGEYSASCSVSVSGFTSLVIPLTADFGIDDKTGEYVSAVSGYASAEYIELLSVLFAVSAKNGFTWTSLAYYDESKTYISGIAQNPLNALYEPPSGAKYVRVSFWGGTDTTSATIRFGTEADAGWSESATGSIVDVTGEVKETGGDAYITSRLAIPSNTEAVALCNVNGGTYTWKRIAVYDADGNCIAIDDTNNTSAIAVNYYALSGVSYIRAQAYPNKVATNNAPAEQLALYWF